MPKIFDDEIREEIRGRMLDTGFTLIKKFGLKKTTIDDVTRASGVAKGTFYNFFKTKEEFVYQIIIYKRRLIRTLFESMIEGNGGEVDRKLLREMLRAIINGDYNLIAYLNSDDMAVLVARWPRDYALNAENDEKILQWVLENARHIRAGCDIRVFINIYKAAATGLADREALYPDAIDETAAYFADILSDYVFGREPGVLPEPALSSMTGAGG